MNTTETKKGTIYDSFLITFLVVPILLGIIICYMIFTSISTAFTAGSVDTTAMDFALPAIGNWNDLFLFVYIGASLGAVISAFAVRTHPIFFIVFIILQILLVALTPMLQTVWQAAVSTPALSTTILTFPMFDLVMQYLPYFAIALSILIALAMFILGG